MSNVIMSVDQIQTYGVWSMSKVELIEKIHIILSNMIFDYRASFRIVVSSEIIIFIFIRTPRKSNGTRIMFCVFSVLLR